MISIKKKQEYDVKRNRMYILYLILVLIVIAFVLAIMQYKPNAEERQQQANLEALEKPVFKYEDILDSNKCTDIFESDTADDDVEYCDDIKQKFEDAMTVLDEGLGYDQDQIDKDIADGEDLYNNSLQMYEDDQEQAYEDAINSPEEVQKRKAEYETTHICNAISGCTEKTQADYEYEAQYKATHGGK